MKTIILGLGNPLFGDDGAGCRVVRVLRNRIQPVNVEIEEFSGAGLDILELVRGYEKAIIIDAIQTESGKIGTIHHLDSNQIATVPAGQAHRIDFLRALELGKKAGLNIPSDISIYAIEAGDIGRVRKRCSRAMRAAIPICAEKIIKELSIPA